MKPKHPSIPMPVQALRHRRSRKRWPWFLAAGLIALLLIWLVSRTPGESSAPSRAPVSTAQVAGPPWQMGNPEGRFTLAFIGYCEESEGAVLELTHNWDTPSYDLGNGFGHVALGVDDAYATCALIKERGGKVTREAGPMKHGTTVIAFVEDPDGYKIELVQTATL